MYAVIERRGFTDATQSATAVPEGSRAFRLRSGSARQPRPAVSPSSACGVISMRSIAQYAETNEAVVYRAFLRSTMSS